MQDKILQELLSNISNLSAKPGVYLMYNTDQDVLYVGKAKNLKNRVSSYFRSNVSSKVKNLIEKVVSIETTVTNNETDALILELQLIKKHKPKYNVIFRDDKSYPFIHLTLDNKYPRLNYFRAKNKVTGKLFGPYPSSYVVKENIELIRKVFKLRNCTDSEFSNRSRPCLQYQINRCSAPCVNKISKDAYNQDVTNAIKLITGDCDDLVKKLIAEMQHASDNMQYELAANKRDQIALIRQMQHQQVIVSDAVVERIDVLGLAICALDRIACIHKLSIRNGSIEYSKQYHIDKQSLLEFSEENILQSFIMQHYTTIEDINTTKKIFFPEEIIIGHKFTGAQLCEECFYQLYNVKIKIRNKVNKQRLQWQKMANENAQQALNIKQQHKFRHLEAILQLSAALLVKKINLIACIDISHTQGEATVAAIVVFDQSGKHKELYRRFNIKTATNDDYQSIREALHRYIKLCTKKSFNIPDLFIIDGGIGQYRVAEAVFKDYSLLNTVTILGIAKGSSRKVGQERLLLNSEGEQINLPTDGLAFLLIAAIRDEAHRFAITAHRKQRSAARERSSLEDIQGVGKQRRLRLLRHFGGIAEVRKASIAEISKVQGISDKLAIAIYNHLHSGTK